MGPSTSSSKSLLITAKEKRQRYRFILEPLQQFGKAEDIDLYVIDRLGVKTILNLGRLLWQNRYKNFILTSPEIYMVWIILLRFLTQTKTQIAVRLGGDLYKNSRSMIVTRLKKKKMIKAVYHLITRGLQFIVLRYCDAFILVSAHLATEKKYRFLKKAPVYIIPQPKELNTDKQRHGIKDRRNLSILTVANLNYKEKYDGIVLLIESLENYANEIVDKNRSLTFHITGGGSYAGLLEKALGKKSRSSNLSIYYNGFQKDIDACYAAANIFVYWSFMDLVPNVMLEAQSHGLPVLFYNTPELKSVFSDSGMSFGSMEELGNKLEALWKEPYLYERYSLRSIENIKNNYTYHVIAKRWEFFLNNLGQARRLCDQ